MRTKGFRGEWLERSTAQTDTGAKKRNDCLALQTFGQCGMKVSAAGGWSGEWPRPTRDAKNVQECFALRVFGRCGLNASVANGWSGERPKPTQEHENAKTALHWLHCTEVTPSGSRTCSAAVQFGHVTWNLSKIE